MSGLVDFHYKSWENWTYAVINTVHHVDEFLNTGFFGARLPLDPLRADFEFFLEL